MKTRREELEELAYRLALDALEEMLLNEPMENMTRDEIAKCLMKIEKERIIGGYPRPYTSTIH